MVEAEITIGNESFPIRVLNVNEISYEEKLVLDFLEEGYGVYIEQIREYLSMKKRLDKKSSYVEQIVRGLVIKNFVRKEERSRGYVYFLVNRNWLKNRK
jgi:predicted transcriptional regulator